MKRIAFLISMATILLVGGPLHAQESVALEDAGVQIIKGDTNLLPIIVIPMELTRFAGTPRVMSIKINPTQYKTLQRAPVNISQGTLDDYKKKVNWKPLDTDFAEIIALWDHGGGILAFLPDIKELADREFDDFTFLIDFQRINPVDPKVGYPKGVGKIVYPPDVADVGIVVRN